MPPTIIDLDAGDEPESFERAMPVNPRKPTEWREVRAGQHDVAIPRVLPHSLEAEEHLLSCCFLDGADVISKSIDARIRPESFYERKHGAIFRVLLDLYEAKKPTEISVVAEELRATGKLDDIGGFPRLAQISSRIPTTAQAGYFIERVREQAVLREIIRSATVAVEDCYGFSGGIEDFAESVASRLKSAADGAAAPDAIAAW